MKPIVFSKHALKRMEQRGAEEEEVISTINSGEWKNAKRGKKRCRHRFNYDRASPINRQFYRYKTVEAIFVEEGEQIVVVTVKVYYSNEERDNEDSI